MLGLAATLARAGRCHCFVRQPAQPDHADLAYLLASRRRSSRWAAQGVRMNAAYVIEVEGEAVGLVVKEPEGFRFMASRSEVFGLDGRLFRSASQAERAAAELQRCRSDPA